MLHRRDRIVIATKFFGNLYHLNAEEEPENPDYPKDPAFKKQFGPRGVIHSYADGRIFSGKQAHELGFVDELGNFDVAVKRAKKLAKVGEANLVKYQPPFAFGNLFRLLGKSDALRVWL